MLQAGLSDPSRVLTSPDVIAKPTLIYIPARKNSSKTGGEKWRRGKGSKGPPPSLPLIHKILCDHHIVML